MSDRQNSPAAHVSRNWLQHHNFGDASDRQLVFVIVGFTIFQVLDFVFAAGDNEEILNGAKCFEDDFVERCLAFDIFLKQGGQAFAQIAGKRKLLFRIVIAIAGVVLMR